MVSISLVKRKYKLADGTEAESKTWYAQIRFTNPRASYLRNTRAAARREAQSVAQRFAREIEENELHEYHKPKHTLEGMFSTWIEEHGKDLRSGKDIAWQIKLLLEVMGGETPIKEITNKTVHAFVHGAKALGKSDVIINRCLTRLRATLRYAGKKWEAPVSDRIDWSVHFLKEPDEKEMYISPQEAGRFLDALPLHIRIGFAFSYYTGCRLNEMETLTWDKVDLRGRVAVVKTKGVGKNPTYRALKLSDQAMTCLDLAARDGTGHPKMRFEGQLVFDLTNRRRFWERARKLIGREDVTWHGIRHTTASEVGRTNKSDKLIGKLLGHTPGSRATERYLHVMDDVAYQALSELPDIGLEKLTMHDNGQVEQTSIASNEPQKGLTVSTKANNIKGIGGRGGPI